MSVWMGFTQAQGVGKKVAVIRTLERNTDYSTAIIQGNPPGIVVTLPDLVKIDVALVDILSAAIHMSISAQLFATVVNYSANSFLMMVGSYNNSGNCNLGQKAISGESISGINLFKVFAVGGAKRMVVE